MTTRAAGTLLCVRCKVSRFVECRMTIGLETGAADVAACRAVGFETANAAGVDEVIGGAKSIG